MRVTWLRRYRVELWIGLIVWFCSAYFFAGGGGNQGAHFATSVALVRDGSVVLDRYRGTTIDLSRAGDHVVSAKPIMTALVGAPAFWATGPLSAGVSNPGNRWIVRAYLTSIMTAGLAFSLLAVAMYRAYTELCMNVIKHAHATHVHIEVGESNGNICVAVSDDGVGMEPGRELAAAASGGSYGLFSIRERFTGLGGAVTITESDLGGAKVLVCAPIRQSEETS